MDVNWRSTINEIQLQNWCTTIVGENQCIVGDMQSVGEVVIKGIQRCFCMDIQRFERDSTIDGTT